MVETENNIMVSLAVDSINRAAHSRHVKIYKEKKRLEALAEQDCINAEQLEKLKGAQSKKKKQKMHEESNKIAIESDSSSDESDCGSEVINFSKSQLSLSSFDEEYSHVKVRKLYLHFCHTEHLFQYLLILQKVPKTDLFEAVDIPDMCVYQNKCLTKKSTGCFLSLIKRKKVIRLDEKQLILMAEKRKLFGDAKPKEERARIRNKNVKKQSSTLIQSAKLKRKKSEDVALLVKFKILFYSIIHSPFFSTLKSN